MPYLKIEDQQEARNINERHGQWVTKHLSGAQESEHSSSADFRFTAAREGVGGMGEEDDDKEEEEEEEEEEEDG